MADQTPHIEPTLSPTGSLAPDYFDRLYAARPDPWDFASSPYEAAKYAATMAALPHPRYHRALELGCSIGVLTHQLAERCDTLLAIDVSAAALAEARIRNFGHPDVCFEQRDLAHQFPAGPFDLILVSEVGYYLSVRDLEQLRENIAAQLAPGGHLLLVHYTGETKYPLTGSKVHDVFRAWSGTAWCSVRSTSAKEYLLDLFEREPAEGS